MIASQTPSDDKRGMIDAARLVEASAAIHSSLLVFMEGERLSWKSKREETGLVEF